MGDKYVQLRDTDGNYIYPVMGKTKTPTGIAVRTAPSGNEAGSPLVLTGMVVVMNYDDSSAKVITGYTTSPAAGTTMSAGTTTINVSYTEGTNTFSTSFSLTLENSLEIVDWSTGTDAQIAAMVEAADAGDIDLTDYWSIGDTRSVSLAAIADSGTGWTVDESQSAQTIELVLMDSTCTGFTITGTSNKPTFIVGMKNCLSTGGYMNSSYTNSGGWNGCARRGWCNSGFYNALPSELQPIFKQFTWQTGSGGGGTSGLTSSNDYFALPPEKAVFGSTSYAQSDEAALYSQWTWYATSSNRVKTVGSSSASWWECSPSSGNSYSFCIVNSDGSANSYFASDAYGLSPFGCI